MKAGVGAGCDVVIVAGPTVPLSSDDALALQKLGKGMVIAAASPANRSPPPTGLEGLLATKGIALPAALAVDPALAVRSMPGALVVTSGFAPHSINAGFAGDRALLLQHPRAVVGGTALVSTTASGWGERDLGSDVAEKGPDDLAGPVALAVEGAGRMIVIGTAESFSTATLAPGGYANAYWLARAIRYAAGKLPPTLAGGTRTPDSVRLVLSDAQRTAVIATCTAGIPLLWIVLGGGIVLWRRRRVT